MKLKLYDYFIMLFSTGTMAYTVLILWMPTLNKAYEGFNIFGAIFMIAFITLMVKVSIVFTGVFLEWGLPRLSKKFKNFKFSSGNKFTLFNKRIEIRIIDVDNRGKVTF